MAHWGVIGHEWAVELLSRNLAAGRVRHAYLFTGPAGVGRRTLALALARALNCTGPQPPCGRCRSCTLIGDGSAAAPPRHPDVRLIEPVESGERIQRLEIRIDQIRDLQHELALTPLEGRYRIAILCDFEAANAHAANALLKTLEEPPPQVILILTASQADVLLPTIVSRCQVLNLRPLPWHVVRSALLARGVPADQAESLAHLCGGRLGWALRAAADPELLARRSQALDDLQRLLKAGRNTRLTYAEELARDGQVLRETLEVWLSWWRDLLLVTTGTRAPLTNADRTHELERLAQSITVDQAQHALALLRDATWHLDRNANPRLLAEVLLLDLPRG